MISLSKLPKPQVLVDNEERWTAAITAKVAAGEALTNSERSRYRHPEIKTALVNETHGKCAYCESKILHIHHGDVEHVYPKSLAPELTVQWSNLTLACEICNQNKSNKDPLVEQIIDPYSTDPSRHLLFNGPLVFPRGSAAGENTRIILDLNRGDLAERRKEHLERIMGIVNTIFREDISIVARRDIFRDLVENAAAPSGAYSAMVKTVVSQITPLLPDEVLS